MIHPKPYLNRMVWGQKIPTKLLLLPPPSWISGLPTALQKLLREERRKNLGKLHWFISKWPTFIFMYMRDFIRTTTRKLEWNLTFPHRSAVMLRLPRVLSLLVVCWLKRHTKRSKLIEKNSNKNERFHSHHHTQIGVKSNISLHICSNPQITQGFEFANWVLSSSNHRKICQNIRKRIRYQSHQKIAVKSDISSQICNNANWMMIEITQLKIYEKQY